jgi:hypothetical protein
MLNAVLNPAAGREVVEVTLLNPFNIKDTAEDKEYVKGVKLPQRRKKRLEKWLKLTSGQVARKSSHPRTASAYAVAYARQWAIDR